MLFGGDERAVTVIIGAVLLLGIAVTAFAVYQADVVPQQNQDVEIEHSQAVTDDLLQLRNVVVDAGYEHVSRSVTVPLGTEYPSRTWAMNPPPAEGTIETTALEDRQVEVTIDGETYAFDTAFIQYEPHYHEHRGAPSTVIEHGLVYDEYGHANVTRDDGVVVGNDRVVIPLLEGSLSETHAQTESVSVETVDEYHVGVAESELEITLPSDAPGRWEDAYDATVDGETVTIEPNASELYLAQIGVGDDFERNDDTTATLAELKDNHGPADDDDGPTEDAEQVEPTDHSAWTAGDNVVFNLENTGTEPVTITEASIDTDLADEFEDQTEPEISVAGGHRDHRGSPTPPLYADGTRYTFDRDGELDGGDVSTMEFRQFQPNTFSDLELVDDASEANVVVTVGFEDGSDETIYLHSG